MSEFGYIGGINQTNESTKGILTPKDIYDLTVKDEFQWDSMWRPIEKANITSDVTNVNFTKSEYSDYGQILIVGNNIINTSTGYLRMRLSANGGTSFSTGNSYSRYAYYGRSNGALTNDRSASTNGINLMITGHTEGTPCNFYILLGGLNNEYKTKVAFYSVADYQTNLSLGWGGGCFNTALRHNAFQIFHADTNHMMTTGTFSTYGLKTGF